MTIIVDDLDNNTMYKGVILPFKLLIPFSVNDTTKGTISNAMVNILNTTVADSAF